MSKSVLISWWRIARELILVAAAWLYLNEVSQAEGARGRELRGLLTLIETEVRSNERILDRIGQDADNISELLLGSSVLSESLWIRHSARLAKLLGDYGLFSAISVYYEQLRFLTALGQIATNKEVESAGQMVEGIKQQGLYVRRGLYKQISTLTNHMGK